MMNDIRNEFVALEPYLIPETKKLLFEIESKNPFKVNLRKVYDPIDCWQINSVTPYVIDMPSWDDKNIICFTHELLHIYFDYGLGMKINHFLIPNLTMPYSANTENPWALPNYLINLINNLQHHKMVPYFIEYGFPLNKLIDNFDNPIEIFETFDNELKIDTDLNSFFGRYVAALSYVNFLALELYFPNPLVRNKLINSFSKEMDNKFVGLRSIFHPILMKWEKECNNSQELIKEINDTAKIYSSDFKFYKAKNGK
jgi:hypothetical protein